MEFLRLVHVSIMGETAQMFMRFLGEMITNTGFALVIIAKINTVVIYLD